MKNKLILLFMVLAAAVLGGVCGNAVEGLPGLDWLSYSKTVGMNPVSVDLMIADITFGIHFSLNVAQVILLFLVLLTHKKIADLVEV